MIQINLVKTQLPTEIDIPKKSLEIFRYGILPIISVAAFLVVVIIVVVYYIFFIKLENKNDISKKAVVSVDNRTIEHKVAIKLKKEEKDKNIYKNHIKQSDNKSNFLETLKNKKEAAFSINIQLSNIPKKIVDNVSDNNSDSQTALYQSIISQDSNLNKEQKIPKAKIDTLYYVTIYTLNNVKLELFLNKNRIKYRIIKYKKSSTVHYDIFVGGFDSYSALTTFSKALKERGYKVHSVENISLLYYVCIDKGVARLKKNLYLKIWGKTPFKIITKAHFKNIYGYKVLFKANSKIINKLKKLKFSPIIASAKNGA